MAKIHRLKHSMTQGELSPYLHTRTDFSGYKNGCRKLTNMCVTAQGPVTRRPGFEYIYDLTSIGLDPVNPEMRLIPFVFNELQAYTLVFFRDTDGHPIMVIAYEDGLIVYPDTGGLECPPGTPISPPAGSIVSVQLPDGWDINGFDYAQSADFLYIAQADFPPYLITRYDHTCWTAEEISFTDPPDDWGPGEELGYPERVTFHQQRLVFACNRKRRQTVWMSKAGDFHDFGVSSPLQDDDAITFTLDSGTQNRIQWLLSARTLNIGTLGNEWTVTGGAQMAVTPKNILAVAQSELGSEPNKAMMAGQIMLYIQRHGRVLNEFIYDYNSDSFKSNDVLVLANHLTSDASIIDWTYQQTPQSLLWCVREDGQLIVCTFQFQHKVIGWSRHFTQGTVKRITCIPGQASRADDVWIIVHRLVEGHSRYYLEKLSEWFNDDEAEWGRFLDSYSTYIGPPVYILQGLDYLEGHEVSILADGTVHPRRTVLNGSITLNDHYSHLVIGLPYMSEVWPISTDINLQDGTAFGRIQRIGYLDVDFYRTVGCIIGRNSPESGESEERKAFRMPADITGQQVPLFTGIVRYDYQEGYHNEPEYFIRQTQPLPMTVRGVVDIVEVLE